jgi:hypothetical protein
MTKKHFEALAQAIIETHYQIDDMEQYEGDGGGADALSRVTDGIANVCASINPLFDRARFLAACGVETDGAK